MKQASYDWVLFDLDETLLDFPVARALERTLQIYGVAPTPPRWRSTMPSTSGSGSEYNSARLTPPTCSRPVFLFAEQVNVAPMAMNDTFLQQIIALSVPLEGWRRP